MKKTLYITLSVALLSSCALQAPLTRGVVYPKMYDEAPLAIAIMPPINKTNTVEAKEYFYYTIPEALCERGYYVLSPFLSMELFKTESAYDAELFEQGPLNKFTDILGADAVLFTTIHEWDKNKLLASVTVTIEYTLRSTKTNEIIFQRKGTITYDTSVKVSGGGLLGMAAGLAASAINTAATDYVKVARSCNNVVFDDIPSGKYSTTHLVDKEAVAQPKEFKKTIKD